MLVVAENKKGSLFTVKINRYLKVNNIQFLHHFSILIVVNRLQESYCTSFFNADA